MVVQSNKTQFSSHPESSLVEFQNVTRVISSPSMQHSDGQTQSGWSPHELRENPQFPAVDPL